jgi:hypothetical protein
MGRLFIATSQIPTSREYRMEPQFILSFLLAPISLFFTYMLISTMAPVLHDIYWYLESYYYKLSGIWCRHWYLLIRYENSEVIEPTTMKKVLMKWNSKEKQWVFYKYYEEQNWLDRRRATWRY